MMMMVFVDVPPVDRVAPAGVSVPPFGPVAPIPGRSPAYPVVSPEPVINNRTIDIYRFDHVVATIDELITDNLHHYFLGSLFYQYSGHILIDVLRQNGLDNNQVVVAVLDLHYSEVVYLSVAVQVQVAEVTFLGVQFLLKGFQVGYFAKQSSYGL